MPRVPGICLGMMFVLCSLLATWAKTPAEAARFEVPLDVSGLPAGGASVVVHHEIDLAGLLRAAGRRGVVDENSIRLTTRGDAATKPAPVPLQFTPTPVKPPTPRTLLPGTRPEISISGEYAVDDPPENAPCLGTLTWKAIGDAEGRARFVLSFESPREGRAVVVPYPPYNLRIFDEKGRIAHPPAFPWMQVRPQWPREGVLQIFDGDQAVVGLHLGPALGEAREGNPALRRPFLDPVIGPTGQPYTATGKTHDPTGSHAHHDGLWVAHNLVDGENYWANSGGVIAHEAIEAIEDGPLFARVVARSQWIASGETRLKERRSVTVYRAEPDVRLIDIRLELSPPGDRPVTLAKTSFGLLAVRVPATLSVLDGGGAIANARGGVNEREVHLNRAEWLDLSGPVAPETPGGVAILDHPMNPNYPTMWHCRDDGWAGAAVSGVGDVTIPAGGTLAVQYRVVLHRGDAESGRVAAHHAAFVAAPKVEAGKAVALKP